MKKALIAILVVATLLCIVLCSTNVYAASKAIDDQTESKVIELHQNQQRNLENFQKDYDSESYGLVAYILDIVRVWSIPICFLGIAIGSIHKSVLGIRKLDTLEKGRGLVVTFVTILIICQILPLAFLIVVKFGRG